MLLYQITTNCIVFLIALIGVTFNYNSILITLIGIEVMLLSCSLNFIFFSIYLNDIYGQIFSIFILTVAAAESAIGLAILIISFKVLNSIKLDESKKG